MTPAERAAIDAWAADYVPRSRTAQGLPTQVDDPVVLARAVELLGPVEKAQRGAAA